MNFHGPMDKVLSFAVKYSRILPMQNENQRSEADG
jgi:hypothetical protein